MEKQWNLLQISNGGNTPYIVSTFLGDVGISIGQVKVDEKSNEITAIPELIRFIRHIRCSHNNRCDRNTRKDNEKDSRTRRSLCIQSKRKPKRITKDIRRYFDKNQ